MDNTISNNWAILRNQACELLHEIESFKMMISFDQQSD